MALWFTHIETFYFYKMKITKVEIKVIYLFWKLGIIAEKLNNVFLISSGLSRQSFALANKRESDLKEG
jgi:hypothetical protein